MWRAGVSPALAGVAMGLLTPARPTAPPELARDRGGELAGALRRPWPAALREMLREAREPCHGRASGHDLHPVSAFLVVPLFALANAGVSLERGGLAAPGAGRCRRDPGRLVVGKLVGIASPPGGRPPRPGLRPEGTTGRQLAGAATVAGIGFTVPLFVADLAFPDGRFQAPVKLGLLLASVVTGVAGALVLVPRTAGRCLPPRATSAAVDRVAARP